MMTNIHKNGAVKNFFVKLAAFFILVFLADLLIGNLLRKFYFKQQSGYDYLTTYSMEKANADLMIFGSSRALNIFNTEIFTSRMHLSCYNTGRVGEPVFYHYAVLKSVLKRYKPKMIILSFDAGNFGKNTDAYDRLTVLLPYYKSHPEIRPIVALKGPYEKLKMLSSIYPYNSLLLPVISGNSAHNKEKYTNVNGFIPLKKVFSGPLITFDYASEKDLDSIKINVYKAFIKDCAGSNIKLYIVCPPYMINAIGTDRSITEGKKIALENNVEFLDYSRDTFFTSRPQLFADYRHLNETGVELFSNNVIDKINQLKSGR